MTEPSKKAQTIELSLIRMDGGTQPREAIDSAAVAEYAEAIAAGAPFPPLTVFNDGAELWLADGFHRAHAYRQLGMVEVSCDVIIGTRRDAVLYSLAANHSHGLRRTMADKLKAVRTMLDDPEWSQWSRQRIADACRVTVYVVREARQAMSLGEKPSEPVKFSNKHGRVGTMDTRRIVEANKSRASLGEKPSDAPRPTQAIQQQAVKELRPPDDDADAPPTLAEQLEMARDVAADLAAEVETLRAAGSVDGAEAEIRRLKAMLSAVEAERDMYRNRANEAIRQVKALQRKVDQMERGK